jgi:hypothetical protein
MTIVALYPNGGFVALFVGEEKTPGARSVADDGVSNKRVDKRGSREVEVWLRANMCDYNQEVPGSQLLFTI